MVGFESRSATNPSFASAPSEVIAPTSSPSIDASAIARSGSPFAPTMGTITAAIMGPSDESGPSTRIRDGPNAA